MQLIQLSNQQMKELLPYLDTLLVPVGVVGSVADTGLFAEDLLQVKDLSLKIDSQISGRVLVLPEIVYTRLEDVHNENLPSSVLTQYLYGVIKPFQSLGFTNIVLLYGEKTDPEIIEEVSKQLAENGLKPISFLSRPELDLSDLVAQIIALWRKEM